MKKLLISLGCAIVSVPVFSQNMSYEVRGTYKHPVTMQQLETAQSLTDINPGYPSSWITDYVLTEIQATSNGETRKIKSINDTLNESQKEILRSADLGTDVVIDVEYKRKNAATGEAQSSHFHYTATVIPEVEAQFPGGHNQMMEYVKENAIEKIVVNTEKPLEQVVINFVVNEDGKIVNTRLSSSSGDQQTDRMLIRAISKMPKWKPAELSNGMKVSQDYTFSVGNAGC
jgi:TonB family protein